LDPGWLTAIAETWPPADGKPRQALAHAWRMTPHAQIPQLCRHHGKMTTVGPDAPIGGYLKSSVDNAW